MHLDQPRSNDPRQTRKEETDVASVLEDRATGDAPVHHVVPYPTAVSSIDLSHAVPIADRRGALRLRSPTKKTGSATDAALASSYGMTLYSQASVT